MKAFIYKKAFATKLLYNIKFWFSRSFATNKTLACSHNSLNEDTTNQSHDISPFTIDIENKIVIHSGGIKDDGTSEADKIEYVTFLH